MQWYKVLIQQHIPVHDGIQLVEANGKKICLIRDDGKFYATASHCPHAGGALINGRCKDHYLICPVHRRAYHLENGRGAGDQGDYLQVYPTEIRADGLYIGMEESWWTKIFG